jgi:hypothetical protein
MPDAQPKQPTVRSKPKRLVVCIDNQGYPTSLEKRKIYVSLRDSSAERKGLFRIVDESGEAYLYPSALFRLVELSPSLKKAIIAAA